MQIVTLLLIVATDAAPQPDLPWGFVKNISGSAMTLIGSDCCSGPSQCHSCYQDEPSCCGGPSSCGECLSKHAADASDSAPHDVHVKAHLLTEFDSDFTFDLYGQGGGHTTGHGKIAANTELGQVRMLFKMDFDPPQVVHAFGRMEGKFDGLSIDLSFDAESQFGALRVKAAASAPPELVEPFTLKSCVSLEGVDFTNLKQQMAGFSEMFVQQWTQQLNSFPHKTDPHDSTRLEYHQGPAKVFVSKETGMLAEVQTLFPPLAHMTFDWKELPSGYDGFHTVPCRAPATHSDVVALSGRQDMKLASAQLDKMRHLGTPLGAALPLDLLSILNQAAGSTQDQCQSRTSGDMLGAIVAAFALGGLATFATMKSLNKRRFDAPLNVLG